MVLPDTASEHDFSEILSSLPSLVTEWQFSLIAKLFQKITRDSRMERRATGESAEGYPSIIDGLNLATSIFSCDVCAFKTPNTNIHFFPEVLGHACLQGRPVYHPPGTRTQDERELCHCGDIRLDPLLHAMVEGILQALNLDQATATTAALDALDPKLTCLLCGTSSAGPGALSWRSAVHHHLANHS
ncbi:hypothetical protein C8J57DRAFT_1536007 [Mycena rebaudengoi]|nr:hypothetical protein C8J57DRAFT_1536007 [Mycena rebaudengoi]